MNAGNQLLAVSKIDCNTAILHAITTLNSAGYLVVKSFDLRSAAQARENCEPEPDAYPYQKVILLVYASEGPPDTLVFDSDGTRTLVSLVNDPSDSTHAAGPRRLAQLLPEALFTPSPNPSTAE